MPREPEQAQGFVANQRGAGHIARVFQQANDKGQHKNLGHEDQKGTDAAKEGIRGEIPGHLVADQRHHEVSQDAQACFHRIHGRGRPGENGLEQ